jgi:glycosyltransferase involved in cell wall biosynthesis
LGYPNPAFGVVADPAAVMLLSIVIPIYNEAATLREIVERVRAVPLGEVRKQIVLVDDGSSDGGPAILDELAAEDVVVRKHSENRGKGAALRSGFAAATGDWVLVQDADLEYDPRDWPVVLRPVLDGRADVVYGSRFAGGESHRVLYFWHSVANRTLTLISNMLTNLNLTDMEVCTKLFDRRILAAVELKEDRFGFEPEVTAKIARLDCRIFEVGVSYNGRTYQEGKKIKLRDGWRALWCIVKYNTWARSPRRDWRKG